MSQVENLEKLVKLVRLRLQSKSKEKTIDQVNNVVYIDYNAFTKEMIEAFIETSVFDFNQVPYYTSFTLADDAFVDRFAEVLIDGATLYALASLALIQRGREFQIGDQGITFYPPTTGEVLNTQYSALLVRYWENLKTIKSAPIESKK